MTASRTSSSPIAASTPHRRPKKLLWAVVAVMAIAVTTIVVTVVALSGRGSPAAKPATPPIATVQHHRSHFGGYNEQCFPSRVVHPC